MFFYLLQRYEDYFIYAIVYGLILLPLCIINYCFYGVRKPQNLCEIVSRETRFYLPTFYGVRKPQNLCEGARLGRGRSEARHRPRWMTEQRKKKNRPAEGGADTQ